MGISESEVLASLRVLVCVAKADGTLHVDERRALAAAIESVPLPDEVTLDALLAESRDLDELLAELESREARAEIYRSAYSMANADGSCSPEEQALLDRIREYLSLTAEDTTALQRLFHDSGEGALTSAKKAIEDPEEREAAIRKETLKCAMVSAVLGAFPVPGLAIATDLAVVGLQVTLVRDIGQLWGRTIDRQGAKKVLYGLGLGTGARLAVNNLAKLLPGWGSVVGAATSFASTYALGGVMSKFFARGDEADIEALKSEFKAAEKEGKKVYKESKDEIDAKAAAAKAKLDALNAELESGAVTQAEFERRAAEIV
ncbi:MAG: DUF533 domain-containing protein [Polyangiaceae bacterium]|nr:DUF533 domain-containing protein [Polyangiaceae bacterium]